MNFDFSDDQKMLKDQAARFLADKCPLGTARKALEDDAPYDRALWTQIGEMGWLGTAIPEEFGGLGLGYLELCVLAEELGRALAPVPFASTVYLAAEALLMAGTAAQKKEWLPKIAAGEVIGCFAVSEGPGAARPDTIEASVRDGRLTGRKIPVADGVAADLAVVLAKSAEGDGGSLYLVGLGQKGVKRSLVDTVDPTRQQAVIEFAKADATLLGQEGAGFGTMARVFDRAAVLLAFEQVGGADACLEMARTYALERHAFGRPIGSFQAIKHKLADMYVHNTLARSNAYYGAWALSTEAPDLGVAAAAARVSAIQAYDYAAKETIQTHGGIGFTWEADCHLFLRRARHTSLAIGSLRQWQDRLVSQIEHRNVA